MISYLSGTIHTKFNDSIVLLVGGVGYQVSPTPSTFLSLALSQPLELFIYTHVKEEALELYGFKTVEELMLFKLVLNISGIGPKTAMLVVDRGVKKVESALINADTDFFMTIPRLGRKNAQRIIIELKSKLGGLKDLDLTSVEGTTETAQVIEALQSMGYSRQEAIKASSNIPESENSLERKITFALRQVGK